MEMFRINRKVSTSLLRYGDYRAFFDRLPLHVRGYTVLASTGFIKLMAPSSFVKIHEILIHRTRHEVHQWLRSII
jgi:hypothetical protein